MNKIPIRRAIVSVYDKSNLKKLISYFVRNKVRVFSTGGTFKYLKASNKYLLIEDIAKLTNFKEILDGRVKTLHPAIHAGILAKKNNPKHTNQLEEISAKQFDLVVVNLYPFEKVSGNRKTSEIKCLENIDIGGPTMIRAAAKNFENVSVLTDPELYNDFVIHAEKNNNSVTKVFRKKLAREAFELTSHYEALISQWFNRDNKNYCEKKSSIPLYKISDLRYGENPHQTGSLFKFGDNKMVKLSGKDLSYNNICDLEIAMELAEQFSTPSCVILKHGNPCGVSLDKKQEKAYLKALKCDQVSAFGGVVAFNKPLTTKTAELITKIFVEVVVAPSFSLEVKKILSIKKKLILVKYYSNNKTKKNLKSTRNFILIQDKDNRTIRKKDLVIKTKKQPNDTQIKDMIFAFIVCKFLNSNAVVLASNLSTIGIGVGQTNRLDSAKQAMERMKKNYNKVNVVLASDGFFPFPDIIELCSKNKISAIIQPGGSIQDNIVIEVANKNKIPMVFTGIRHFKH